MRIYISIPINSRSELDIKTRLKLAKQQADEIRAMLKAQGYNTVTPFDINPIGCGLNYSSCMGRCVTELLRCDGIYLGSGWRKSKGCVDERNIAMNRGITIIGDEL